MYELAPQDEGRTGSSGGASGPKEEGRERECTLRRGTVLRKQEKGQECKNVLGSAKKMKAGS